MALPEKKNAMNQVREQGAQRLDEQAGGPATGDRMEEHFLFEDHSHRDERHRGEHRRDGYVFDMDLHPERYPREALSRLEEGILEDEEHRQVDDRLGDTLPDIEHRVDEVRNLSRTLIMLGSFLLIFACVLLLWVGWDLRSGQIFFTTMCGVAVVIGLALVGWGMVERQRVVHLRLRLVMPKREFGAGDRAA